MAINNALKFILRAYVLYTLINERSIQQLLTSAVCAYLSV